MLCNGSVENPRAVDVKGQVVSTCQLTDLACIFSGQRNTAANILGVLDTDQTGDGVMHILATNRCGDVFQGKRAVRLIWDRAGLYPAEGSHASRFVQIDVGLIAYDHFVASPSMLAAASSSLFSVGSSR